MDEKKSKNPVKKNESNKQHVSKNGQELTFFEDFKSEFKKIIWPNRDELAKKTVTVIITSLIVGSMVFAMDTVYSAGYNLILTMLG